MYEVTTVHLTKNSRTSSSLHGKYQAQKSRSVVSSTVKQSNIFSLSWIIRWKLSKPCKLGKLQQSRFLVQCQDNGFSCQQLLMRTYSVCISPLICKPSYYCDTQFNEEQENPVHYATKLPSPTNIDFIPYYYYQQPQLWKENKEVKKLSSPPMSKRISALSSRNVYRNFFAELEWQTQTQQQQPLKCWYYVPRKLFIPTATTTFPRTTSLSDQHCAWWQQQQQQQQQDN